MGTKLVSTSVVVTLAVLDAREVAGGGSVNPLALSSRGMEVRNYSAASWLAGA